MKKMRCSGCFKGHSEVTMLIALRKGFICDECISLCVQIVFGHICTSKPSPKHNERVA